MIIRPPARADARALAEAHVLAWQRAYAGIMPDDFLAGLDLDDAHARWAAQLESDPSKVLVAEAEGRARGFAMFGVTRDDEARQTGEIYAINIHPDWWRRGLGARLLAESLEAMGPLGFESVTLWVLEENASARRFYERQGWHHDGARKDEAPGRSPALPHLRYRWGDSPDHS